MTMTKWVCTFWDGAAEDSEDRYQLLRIVGHGSTAVVRVQSTGKVGSKLQSNAWARSL